MTDLDNLIEQADAEIEKNKAFLERYQKKQAKLQYEALSYEKKYGEPPV